MQQKSSRGGGSFLVLLFFIFLALKLTDVIDWSWWWVTSPLWLPAALGFVLIVGLSIAGVSIYKLVSKTLGKKAPDRGADAPRTTVIDGGVIEAQGSEVSPDSDVPPAGGVTPSI
jgi:phosphate/sulfate permease